MWITNAEINSKLDLIIRLIARVLALTIDERKELMALQPEVQDLIDSVTNNTNLVASLKQASDAQGARITSLEAQLAAIVPGQAIDAEDLQAIKDEVAALKATNDSITTAVPANTPAA